MTLFRTIEDIQGIDIKDCYFSKDEYNRKFVTLSIENKNFQHRFFREDSIGSYIIYDKEKYYYPYNDHVFLI